MTSPSPGINSPAVTTHNIASAQLANWRSVSVDAISAQPVGFGFGARFAQSVGLGFAAPFGHGFGEIGEQHGEPQPQRNLQTEAEFARVTRDVGD